jgi:hypothetical protein
VLAGWLIGGVVLWGFLKVEKRLGAWLRGRTLNQMALLSLGSALVMIILVLIPRALLNGFVVPEIWKQNALAAYPGNVITPVSFEGVFTIAGTWFGMTLGLAWMYHRQGGFRADGTLRQRALRYLVGIAGVLIFWYGLGMVLPREANALSYSLRFTRYALVGLWVAALAPLLFQRMGLSAQPEPLPSLSTGENHL